MFKFFKDIPLLEKQYKNLSQIILDRTNDQYEIEKRIHAIQDYLDIEFFHGDKSKPHYRKKRVIVKKLGRPRKIK
jgi:hypothetical protein